jgi:hypothetical protein
VNGYRCPGKNVLGCLKTKLTGNGKTENGPAWGTEPFDQKKPVNIISPIPFYLTGIPNTREVISYES